MNGLNTPIRFLKGVGPKNSEYLSKIGIETAEDLLYYLPSRYEDRSRITPIRSVIVGQPQVISGEVRSLFARRAMSGQAVVQAVIADESGSIQATWFNQPYLKDVLKNGQKLILYGKVELFDRPQIVQPEYEIAGGDGSGHSIMGRIVPVYSLTANIKQKYLRNLIMQALARFHKDVRETMPTYIIARQKLVDLKFAVSNIHFPSSFDAMDRSYRRIVFEEFFCLQLALAIKKRAERNGEIAHKIKASSELVESFRKAIPFELTEGQKKAAREIEKDMSSGRPMNRLLEGDVGSGKTVVASYGLLMSVASGCQGVIMAPTEILARQHFLVLSELLMPLGVNVALLISGIDENRKREIYADIKEGRVDIVVGTHAVIQESVEFKSLGLVVIDEQHKFGVSQRLFLRQKGYSPHVLIMTATPIPRTLALTVYGDLDISIIKELPKGRKPIVTYLVEEEKRQRVYGFIREELDRGRQAYVVCPAIENCNGGKVEGAGSIDLYQPNGLKGANEMFAKLKDEVFPGYGIGLLHGRMSTEEKDSVMKDFKKGKIKLLVSTTVIEVGVDVPNATVMLVENAERFGLSQLHQLRGRIGRGEHESYCILLADPKTDEARKRLEAIEGTLDGFRIAEADLDIRGPGEFFGTRQHGMPELRFGDILKDFDIMESARREAFDLVSRDPEFKDAHHRQLKERLVKRFKGKLELIKVG